MSELKADLVFLDNANGDSGRIHSPIPMSLLDNGNHGSGGDSPVMMVAGHELPFSLDPVKGTQRLNGKGRPPPHSNVSNQVDLLFFSSLSDWLHDCKSMTTDT